MTGAAVDLLAAVPLFTALNADDRAELASAFSPQHFADGSTLMVQNDPGDGLHIVHSGTVRVGRRLPGGGFADTARLSGCIRASSAMAAGRNTSSSCGMTL